MTDAPPFLVVVGGSWGGTAAVSTLLGRLTDACRAAIVIALHRAPTMDDKVLVGSLQRHSVLPIVEAEDKLPLAAGHVVLAPADYHVLIEADHVALSTEGPVRFSRPSIDVLFESAAESWGERVAAVVLTGANDDGARGVVAVKAAGGMAFVQDPSTAERAEMPAAAIATGAVDRVLPVTAIAAAVDTLGATP